MGNGSRWDGIKSWFRRRADVRDACGRPYLDPSGASSTANSGSVGATNGSSPAPGGSGSGSSGISSNGSSDPIASRLIATRPHVDGTIRDIVELEYLNGLQAQRKTNSRIERQQAAGMAAIAAGRITMPAIATTPDTAAQTSTATDDDQAIYNRSPTINHNYYHDSGTDAPTQPQPSRTTGIPTWVVVLLIAGVLGLAAWWWLYGQRSQPVPTPKTGSTEYIGITVIPGGAG